MPRAIDQALIDAFASDAILMVDLVEFEFSSPIRFNSSTIDLDYDGKTWQSNQYLQKLGDVSESADLRVGTTTITLAGADKQWFALLLTQNYIGLPVHYLRAALDPSYQVIGHIELFSGTVSGATMAEDGTNSEAQVHCSSHWANFQMINGRLTNDNDQQAIWPGDLGFEFAPKTTDQVPWGTGAARG